MTKEQEMELDYLYFLLGRDKTPKRAWEVKKAQLNIQVTKDMAQNGFLSFNADKYNEILKEVKSILPKVVTNTLKEMKSSNENQVLNAPKALKFCNGKTKFQLMCSHLQKSIRKQEQSKSNNFERGM